MESTSHVNSKRIAKNTIVLYVRTIVTMLIALYTSRVILKNLGVEDYGLYNVIGGFVSLLSVVVSGLTTSIQRFLSYEIGSGNRDNLRNVFSVSFYTVLGLVFIVIILAETLGLWFVNNKLNIPDGRSVAANFIYQFSIISFSISLMRIPYLAILVSHERMTVFAFIGIFDAVLKLIIASALAFTNSDRLILYGGLMILVSVITFSTYKFICAKDYPESRLKVIMDKSLLKRIFSFSSWTLLGQGAMVCANQGNNMLINIFHSVSANAASGIGNQVNAALTSLTHNFFSAYQPQITKSYAAKEYKSTLQLVYSSTKLSFFLTFLVAVPILFNLDDVLKIWLGTVPEFTNIFCLIFITSSIVNSFGNPCWTAIFASGNIKMLQILSAILYFFDIILVYLFFSKGLPPYYAPLAKLLIDCFITLLRIFIAKKFVVQFSVRCYIKKVLVPIVLTASIIISIGYFLFVIVDTTALKIVFTLILVITSLVVSYFIGLSGDEKETVDNFVKRILNKRNA